MVTPASLNGAYWALAVPAASVDAIKSPAITILMNTSLIWFSPLSAECPAFWHMCGSLSAPPARWSTLRHRSKAAEHGEVRAQCNLGVLLGDPQGVPRNAAEAAIWFRKAADQGVPL